MKTTLYRKAMDLARQADFCFWEGEHWAPELQAIDWSSDYDREIVELVKLTVLECASLTTDPKDWVRIMERFGLSK